MLRKPLTTLLVAAGLLSVRGCSSVADTDWLKDLTWNPMPDPRALVVGVAATSA